MTSLFNQEYVADEILVVVKELSSPPAGLDHGPPSVRVLQQVGNGPADARNVGIRSSVGDVIVLVDSDCVPSSPRWLRSMLSPIISGQYEIVCGRTVVEDGNIWLRFVRELNGLGAPDYGSDRCEATSFRSYPATSVAMERKLVTDVGYFDENLVVAEDLDFFLRAWRQGHRVEYCPEAVVLHAHRDSFGKLVRHAFLTGTGSIGFFRKYGFFTRFLRGTAASVLLVCMVIPIAVAIYLHPIGILVPVSAYAMLFLFFRGRGGVVDALVFPIVLVSYCFALGVGVLIGRLTGGGRK